MKKVFLTLIAISLIAALSACTQSLNQVQAQSETRANGITGKDATNSEEYATVQNQDSSGNEKSKAAVSDNASNEPASTVATDERVLAAASDKSAPSGSSGASSANYYEVKKAIYQNSEYSFEFTLPGSWAEFRIIEGKWEGLVVDDKQGEKVTETGPMISIRHPLWTESNPRQDIPIMIFTLNQWEQLQQGKFHIGAAPIGPTELGRNDKYVFALPARYNYAFPEGYEEVEQILQSSPLKTSK